MVIFVRRVGAVPAADPRRGVGAGQLPGPGVQARVARVVTPGVLPLLDAAMAYGAKRDRLVLFSDIGPNKGDVVAYDLKTDEARWLGAAGREQALVPSRETIYLPERDSVLTGGRVNVSEKFLRLLYDCAKNAWFGVELGGSEPAGKGAFNNSMGLMVDPDRKLVWAVGQNSHVHEPRLDIRNLRLVEIE